VSSFGHRIPSSVVLLPHVASGVRWTFWLAVVAVPFSYATTFLLARAGPEVLGAYGVLGVYASVVACFFYVGGNAVTIKYVSELQGSRRLSFLTSYVAVLSVALVPWLIAATLWPRGLHYIFGDIGDTRFQLLVVCLSPVYLFLLFLVSTLKGILDMAWAQALSRAIPIGSCVIYVLLFTISPSTLVAHHIQLIWGVFLTLALLAALVGFCRFVSRDITSGSVKDLRFFLPAGFWKYTAGVQGSSLLGFFSINLDALLILHAGGVAVLGRYVAIMTIALAVPLLSGFLLESFVPILMSALAQKNAQSAGEITTLFARIIFPTALAVATLQMALAGPIATILGAYYTDLKGVIQLLAPFAAIQALSAYLGTILVVTGSPHREAFVKAFRIIVFAITFQFLWIPYQLLGAIFAWVIAEISYHGVVLYLVKRHAGYQLSLSRTYRAFIIALALSAGATTVLESAPVLVLFAFWLAVLTLFACLARYTFREIKALVGLMAPRLSQPHPRSLALSHEGDAGR
jgi:O-antigen/teichoic acid export membrane protein